MQCKYQKASGFLIYSEGREGEHWFIHIINAYNFLISKFSYSAEHLTYVTESMI